MRNSTPPDTGEDRRDAALALVRQRRAALVRRGQRALLQQLIATGAATADDVRVAVELPPVVDPRCMGAVPGELADAGIIHAAGYGWTARPAGHGRPVLFWRLSDAAAARAWLMDHPEAAGWRAGTACTLVFICNTAGD
jgi:hypothetical protein